MTNPRTVGTFLALAWSTMLAACVQPESPSSGDSADLPMQSESLHLGFANMIVLADARPGDTVTFRVEKEAAQRECDKLDIEGRRDPFWWVNVWNRTGLADYWHVQVPEPIEGDLQFEIELPPNPPFLVWPGFECPADVRIEFYATNWSKTPVSVADDGDPIDKQRIVDAVARHINITIPAGQTEGSTILPLYGRDFFLMARPGAVPLRGQPYGDFYMYEPHQRPPDGEWYQHEEFTPLGDERIAKHTGIGINGDFLLLVQLKTPTVEETVWQAQYAWIWTFRPKVQEYGFEYPFSLYDFDPAK